MKKGIVATEALITGVIGFTCHSQAPERGLADEVIGDLDEPIHELPTLIDSPEGVRTFIGRDIFGKATQVTS